jgi:hypothetical protein
MAFFAILLATSILGERVGVPVWLEVDPYTVDYGRGAEDERSSITTAYGWGVIVLSVLAAVAIWHVVQGKQTTPDGRANFLGSLLGSVVLIVGGVPLWKVFANSHGLTAALGNLLELGLFGAAIFAGWKLSGRLKISSPTQGQGCRPQATSDQKRDINGEISM